MLIHYINKPWQSSSSAALPHNTGYQAAHPSLSAQQLLLSRRCWSGHIILLCFSLGNSLYSDGGVLKSFWLMKKLYCLSCLHECVGKCIVRFSDHGDLHTNKVRCYQSLQNTTSMPLLSSEWWLTILFYREGPINHISLYKSIK